MSLQRFKRELKAAEAKIIKASEKAIRAVAVEMFGEIISRTPVGNPAIWQSNNIPKGYTGGRLRGNWQATLNKPASGDLNRIDKAGSYALNDVYRTSTQFKLDDSIFLTNNLPYAVAIEDGHSTQRPSGMVKTTIVSFKPTLNKLAKKYRV